ncbi:hypothetical protein Y032_0202g1803, partial [Ancylostoma ceylanicum]
IQAKHQVRQKVFGVFNAEQEPNFKNFGDPEPFMIRGMDQQYPRDLYVARENRRSKSEGCPPNRERRPERGEGRLNISQDTGELSRSSAKAWLKPMFRGAVAYVISSLSCIY